MKTLFSLLATVCLVLGMAVAHADEYGDEALLDAKFLPKEHLFEAVGNAGQSMDDFAYAISPRLRAFSDQTGFEACGVMAQFPDGRFAVSIISVHSHVACVLDPKVIPAGSKSVGLGIHSHGRIESVRMNKADRLMQGLSNDPRTASRSYVYGQNLNAFSARDLDGAGGYLATENGALFQDGYSHVRVVPAPANPVATTGE